MESGDRPERRLDINNKKHLKRLFPKRKPLFKYLIVSLKIIYFNYNF